MADMLDGDAAHLTPAWTRIREMTRSEIGSAAFESWINPLTLIDARDGAAVLTAPTNFIGDWVERHYGDVLVRNIAAEFDGVTRLKFVVRPARRPAARPAAPETPRAQPEAAPRMAETRAEPAPRPQAQRRAEPDETAQEDLPSSPLDPRFTFDRFVVGKPNELAHAAARRVAEAPEVTFNPLFLYGGVGLGKTHLMHAIAWKLTEDGSERRVLYLSAEQFMYRFVQALRFKDTISFKQLFRSVDVLMVDDVQFIAGKDSTQEEFFHTFNALVDQGKQIVISADRAPGEIDGLEERIKSRLQWGLVVDLHPTDYELRLGILQSKLESMRAAHPDVEIHPKVLEFLAHRISSNVRVLEGALTRLLAFASLVGRPVDLDMTQECLADILRANDKKVTVEEIQRKVAAHYNLRMSDLLSPRRARAIARPRQIAMYLAKTLTSKSLPEIGRRFGGRDHTTVIHAVKTIEKLKDTDSAIAEDIELLRRMLEA
ncbi:chromosomal replication initiator protein DnaA [Oceanicella actignis]|uniref:Chromosomal replication initiator protein DnaA n=1 Tax=Oceanicella actignis TaxID=1189325 RepID=A0A1M7SUA0_9RHOB|nr:chromosomal replication initiator protein DnaA [Oceanicella actignis]TYO90682.1 chromosomal replication initiator protein [Oceanicella actignis]SES70694.1 chromosomal replication initiator protein DnaA [Oceanicella actignis]SHN61964.1 chromosomal replication initiator protein [Oceanicella actignis]